MGGVSKPPAPKRLSPTATTDPYLFAGNSLFGPDIVALAFTPGQILDASDLFAGLDGAGIGPGTYGLGTVTFNVASGASAGQFDVILTPVVSSLSDPNANIIPITLANGTITVNVENSVPEPSSLALLAAGLCGTVALRLRGRA